MKRLCLKNKRSLKLNGKSVVLPRLVSSLIIADIKVYELKTQILNFIVPTQEQNETTIRRKPQIFMLFHVFM